MLVSQPLVPRASVIPRWRRVDAGEHVAVAVRDALGTDARVALWPPEGLAVALAAVDEELSRLDRQASRFREDSEISRVHESPRRAHRVSHGLARAVLVALEAARWTGGRVDPTVGSALVALGYDRDFASVAAESAGRLPVPGPVRGWRSVVLRGRVLRLPDGVCLDLGATGKGLGADRAAAAAQRVRGHGGVLVSLGGDIAVAGQPPVGGWPVAIAESSLTSLPGFPGFPGFPGLPGLPGLPSGTPGIQVIRLAAGAVATSSVACRQWRFGGQRMHHILDPRTGYPVTGPWRTVSVAAPWCAIANAAATAAIVAGPDGLAWLEGTGLPARLVGHDETIRLLGGWPGADGGALPEPTHG